MESKANSNIQCEVPECQYHSGNKNYCTLDSILVGKHEAQATKVECTDCQSFKVK